MNKQLDSLLRSTRSLRDRVASHDVYRFLENLEQVRIFMEHHVYAVWDFMALVKSLQNALTCTCVPWLPQGDPISRRLINEITLDEESDEDGKGGYRSHFELYLGAMEQCGADTSCIRNFINRIRRNEDALEALHKSGAPKASQAFVASTWKIVTSHSPHKVAAAFAIGREEIVPEMFQRVIESIRGRFPKQMDSFAYYLERHINVDKERHWPMAMRMLEALCGEEGSKWKEAVEAAQTSLKARIQLWDDVKRQILLSHPQVLISS
ncbi:MAG: DUF3050 domain-containing protein [Elusimicrobia bacterium]|nr:DUF3050 domain-containing protein [Elusimicrobiota bacterium]